MVIVPSLPVFTFRSLVSAVVRSRVTKEILQGGSDLPVEAPKISFGGYPNDGAVKVEAEEDCFLIL
jgi:hypothetical protein